MSAGCLANRARSRCGVSPVRTLIWARESRRPCAAPYWPSRPAASAGSAPRPRPAPSAAKHKQFGTRAKSGAPPSRRLCSLSLGGCIQHQSIQAPQKRSQRLARSGRRQDQRILPARNHRPAHPLRRSGRIEHRLEPCFRHRMKAGKWIGTGIVLLAGLWIFPRHDSLRLAQVGWRRQSE